MVTLGPAQLDLMALQLDKLLLELLTGEHVAAQERWEFWLKCRDMCSDSPQLYWDRLCEHGKRLMTLANR